MSDKMNPKIIRFIQSIVFFRKLLSATFPNVLAPARTAQLTASAAWFLETVTRETSSGFLPHLRAALAMRSTVSA
jgi:hypothetical protein